MLVEHGEIPGPVWPDKRFEAEGYVASFNRVRPDATEVNYDIYLGRTDSARDKEYVRVYLRFGPQDSEYLSCGSPLQFALTYRVEMFVYQAISLIDYYCGQTFTPNPARRSASDD